MRAAVYLGPGQLEIRDVELGPPAAGEAVLEVEACGVCATDAKTFFRGHPLLSPPRVLGHEVAGRVVEAGPEAGVAVGTRLVVPPYAPCGACVSCRRGQFTQCSQLFATGLDPGGFAERVRVPASLLRQAVAVPDHVPAAEACLVEPLACALHACRRSGMEVGEQAIVVGDGPMGFLLAAVLRAGGVRVAACGQVPERLEALRRVAQSVVSVREDGWGDQLLSWTGGEGADAVFVAATNPEAFSYARRLVRRGGRVVLFAGLPPGTLVECDAAWLHYQEVTLLGSFGFSPLDFHRAAELIFAGAVELRGLVTAVRPLAEAREALTDVWECRGLKVVLVPRAD